MFDVNEVIDINDFKHYRHIMATITIRNLDDEVKRKLRLRAARHDRSMEAEARAILSKATQAFVDDELPTSPDAYLHKIQKARKLWKPNMDVNEVLKITRGE